MLLLASTSIAGEPEIYRCAQADGTIAFQEMPCASAKDETPDGNVERGRGESDVANSADESVEPNEDRDESLGAVPIPRSAARAECEKSTRDAIDSIDLEMRAGFTEEEGQRYLAELLELTKRLRACKQL